MILKNGVLVPRIDGFCWYKGRRIKARKHGDGVGVALVLEHSPVDEDFDENILFLSESQRREILAKFTKSDDLTVFIVGHDWDYGVRPYKKTLSLEEREDCSYLLDAYMDEEPTGNS